MSQAKLAQRNMKVLRKQFFPESTADGAEPPVGAESLEADIQDFNSLMSRMADLRDDRGPLLSRALVLCLLLSGVGASTWLTWNNGPSINAELPPRFRNCATERSHPNRSAARIRE